MRIQVVTPPNKATYSVGETIDYTGMVVKAYDLTGNLWTDDNHRDGVIPINELILRKNISELSTEASFIGGQQYYGWTPNKTIENTRFHLYRNGYEFTTQLYRYDYNKYFNPENDFDTPRSSDEVNDVLVQTATLHNNSNRKAYVACYYCIDDVSGTGTKHNEIMKIIQLLFIKYRSESGEAFSNKINDIRSLYNYYAVRHRWAANKSPNDSSTGNIVTTNRHWSETIYETNSDTDDYTYWLRGNIPMFYVSRGSSSIYNGYIPYGTSDEYINNAYLVHAYESNMADNTSARSMYSNGFTTPNPDYLSERFNAYNTSHLYSAPAIARELINANQLEIRWARPRDNKILKTYLSLSINE